MNGYGRRQFLTGHAMQAAHDGLQVRCDLFQPAEACKGALLHPAVLVAIGLGQLQIAAWSGASELDEHAHTIPDVYSLSTPIIVGTILPKRATTGFSGKSPLRAACSLGRAVEISRNRPRTVEPGVPGRKPCESL